MCMCVLAVCGVFLGLYKCVLGVFCGCIVEGM